jgi:hypothetical protein
MINDRKQQNERRAVRDAQNLIAYTAKSGIEVDNNTLKTLIASADIWDTDDWTPEFSLEFWNAYGIICKLIKPATVDSVRAIIDEPNVDGFGRIFKSFIGKNPAQRTTNVYTLFTLIVLLILLIFQIYWVIGKGLETRLSELLNNEVELTTSINSLQQDLDEVELRFKITEAESTGLSGDRSYNFYYTPDWERETLHLNDEIQRLASELEFIRVQLDRNNDILLIWAGFWSRIIQEEKDNPELITQIENQKEQIEALSNLIKEDPEGVEEIKGIQSKLDTLHKELAKLTEDEGDANLDLRAQIQKDIADFEQRLANPDLSQQIINQRKTNMADLNSKLASLDRQNEGEKTKEMSRRARLLAVFLLDILQSYILPLLYGLLGASAYILRSSAKEIENVTYSLQSNRGYLLRLALGTLAGLIVGWFIFLLPGQTFLASISPFALAFLVGYNIEIIFSWMDNFINRVQKRSAESLSGELIEPEPSDGENRE